MGQGSIDHLVSIGRHSNRGIMMTSQVTAINFNVNPMLNSPPTSMNSPFPIYEYVYSMK